MFPHGQEGMLDKRKVITDLLAVDQTTEEEFQLNLIPKQYEIPADAMYDLLVGMPAIGIYGRPYNFRQRLALIKLPPLLMANAMPDQLRKTVASALGARSINQALTGKTAYAQIMVNGQTEDKKPGPYNMVFHPFGYAYKKQKEFRGESIPMGIFSPDGITGQDIATNRFKALNVNPHNGGAYFALSPNNAKFNITRNRALSTFWSAAYSPNKQFVTITYHILANTDAMQDALAGIFQQSETLGDLLTRLSLQAEEMSGADQKTLQNTIETIRVMVTPKEVAPIEKLRIELNALESSLRRLTKQLSQLS